VISMPSRGFLFAALLVAALPVAAAATSIADIVDHPDTYAGTQVTVIGTVTQQPLGYLGESLYTITADNRRITVVSGQAPPAAGDHLQVSGNVTVKPPDEEFTWPPVIHETTRQAAP